MSIGKPSLEATHDANESADKRDHQSHLGNLGAVTLGVTPWLANDNHRDGSFNVDSSLAGCVVRIALPDERPKRTGQVCRDAFISRLPCANLCQKTANQHGEVKQPLRRRVEMIQPPVDHREQIRNGDGDI